VKKALQLFTLVFIFLQLVLTARYLLFQSYIHLQKVEFRKNAAITGLCHHETIHHSELFANDSKREWKDNGKELLIAGKVYDIVGMINRGDSVVIRYITDDLESRLFCAFNKTNEQNSDSGLTVLKTFLGLQYVAGKPVFLLIESYQGFFCTLDHSFTTLAGFKTLQIKPPSC
jgi:hypothetical protein